MSQGLPELSLRAFARPLSLQPVPGCRELVLWLIDEAVDLEVECHALGENDAPPYWAFCWGAGQVLARYVLDHPGEVAGRRVLDLGCGSGVVAIAAAMAGASSVMAVDNDLDSLAAVRMNALANDQSVETSTELPEDWDLLLASDVYFEAGPREYCEENARNGRSVIVCEPNRPGAKHPQQRALLWMRAVTLPDVDSPTTSAALYRLA